MKKAKKITAYITAAAMMFSLTALPAFAAGDGDSAAAVSDESVQQQSSEADAAENAGSGETAARAGTEAKPLSVTTSAAPTACTYAADDTGKLKVTWEKAEGASGYMLFRGDYTAGKWTSEPVYEGPDTAFEEDSDNLIHGHLYSYKVRAVYRSSASAADEDATYSADRICSTKFRYIAVSKLYISHTGITINKGEKRKLRNAFAAGTSDYYRYKGTLTGRWTSSDTSVASVSQAGNVTARSAGRAVISYVTINGKRSQCIVTVPSSATLSGSVYTDCNKYPFCTRILGSTSMVSGTQNRLNGTVISDSLIRKIYVRIYTLGGKRRVSYSRTVNAHSCNMTKISRYVKFSGLGRGSYMVRVKVKTAMGTKTVYSEVFKVTGTPARANKGRHIVKWALSRRGDPYSQARRGYLNYTDCSYLSLWCYRQGAKKSLPATAASQYKYCVSRGKTIGKSCLKPGDLVFWGGKKNGRYKGIFHVAIYLGSGMIVHADGYRVDVACIEWNWAKSHHYKIYYGRPY